jgi:Kef-type K+ transport system membrane component KefB
MDPIIVTLGLMIIAASIFALIAQRLRQPLLLGYVVAGVMLGPALTGLVADPAPLLAFITELGLIFLLFIIGLELDLSKLQDVGKVSALIGTLQVLIVTLICAIASLLFGLTFIQGLYLGLAISFSSTIVVVKILTESKEIDSLHGELTLGILLTQDLLAVISLSILGTLRQESAGSLLEMALGLLHITLPQTAIISFLMLLANLALFGIAAFLFYKLIMPLIFKDATASAELLFVVTLAVVLILSALAGLFTFALAMGAFLAGIVLSTVPYSHEIIGRVKPLKDFFLLLFFVSLGLQITLGNVIGQFMLVLLIIVGTMVLKPIVTFFICKLFKYNNRTSLFVSLHLAQASEFSLVLLASGITLGIASGNALTALVIVTIITMVLASYIIEYDERIYRFMRPLIAPLDLLFGTRPEEHTNMPEKYQPELIIIGVNTTTAEAIDTAHAKKRMLIVDYNPRKLIQYKEKGIPTVCTDAIHSDFFESIDLTKTEIIVSAVHELSSNLHLLKITHEAGKKHKRKLDVIVSTSSEDNARKLYRAGATVVLIPEIMGRKLLSETVVADDPAVIRNIGKVYYEEMHKNFVFMREI